MTRVDCVRSLSLCDNNSRTAQRAEQQEFRPHFSETAFLQPRLAWDGKLMLSLRWIFAGEPLPGVLGLERKAFWQWACAWRSLVSVPFVVVRDGAGGNCSRFTSIGADI